MDSINFKKMKTLHDFFKPKLNSGKLLFNMYFMFHIYQN